MITLSHWCWKKHIKGRCIDGSKLKYCMPLESIKAGRVLLCVFFFSSLVRLPVLLKWEERLEGSVSSAIKQCSLILVSRIMEIWTDPIQKLTHSLWMLRCPIWLWYKSLKEKKETCNIFFIWNIIYTCSCCLSNCQQISHCQYSMYDVLWHLWRQLTPAWGRKQADAPLPKSRQIS